METTYIYIPRMDCQSEVQLVRLALQDLPVTQLDFDLGRRLVAVKHQSTSTRLLEALAPLNFGACLANIGVADAADASGNENSSNLERKTLVVLFMINATLFVVELVAGLLYDSAGLLGDSIDMLADAAVYAMSLYAVGRSLSWQRRAARFSGHVQLLLACALLIEVARRFAFGSDPEPAAMTTIAVVALFANLLGLALISRHRNGGLHMRASWIFTSTDVLANVGVVVAGVLIDWTGSRFPDLVVGLGISLVILIGAAKIRRITDGSAPLSVGERS